MLDHSKGSINHGYPLKKWRDQVIKKKRQVPKTEKYGLNAEKTLLTMINMCVYMCT